MDYKDLWLSHSHRINADDIEKYMDEEDFKIAILEWESAKTVSRVELPVKPEIAEELEKQFLERQLAKIEVLSCKGDPCGNHLPTKILLQLGKETKWFIKVD